MSYIICPVTNEKQPSIFKGVVLSSAIVGGFTAASQYVKNRAVVSYAQKLKNDLLNDIVYINTKAGKANTKQAIFAGQKLAICREIVKNGIDWKSIAKTGGIYAGIAAGAFLALNLTRKLLFSNK